MKYIYILLLLLLFSSSFYSCKETKKDRKQIAIELMSAQTLGLAYLEEIKLEEAEKEFLKFIKLAPDEKIGYANLGLVYLRMGKYDAAEKELFKAIKLDPKDADIKLLLATVYQMNNERQKAIKVLMEALKFAPEHPKVLYNLAELYSLETDKESLKLRKKYLIQLVKKSPINIVPRLHLIELYIQNKESDKALEQLEIIQKQFPEFPKDALDHYKKTLLLLRKPDTENAIIQFIILQNYLKVTFPYQEGIMRLKGPGGTVVGSPLISYNKSSFPKNLENTSILDIIKFTEVTTKTGLDIVPSLSEDEQVDFSNSTHVETADYDGDGDTDIYISSYDTATSSYKNYLFNNNMGMFNDVAKEVGIKHSGKEFSATFADYDNNGFLDLYIVKEGGDILYQNAKKSSFKNVTESAKIGSKKGGIKALFFDMDHDGDLDLYEIRSNSNLVFRNNGDGTFTEQGEKMGLSGEDDANSIDVAFGDFEDDGDIDLLVINDNSSNALYANQRQSIFKDITEESGLKSNGSSSSVSVGDFNNDGFLDLFITSLNGEESKLLINLGNGSFDTVNNSKDMFEALQKIKAYDAKFFDFDNDGFLDIIIVGKSKQTEGQGVLLYHNDGNGSFKDVSHLLPKKTKSGRQISIFDYNEDGDLDIIITGLNGGVFLLRNDGGNMNHYVNMKLVGLRTGSTKNNYFGIGAKVEMRAGDLYQTMVVTKPNIYFGLGNREKIDVLRITWTNGVPQNILLPAADQSLIEEQTLKGSCPFLYTWNGSEYIFVKDITWRSALGMPLGIMGGTTKYAFADASDDYIKIPGNMLKPKNNEYSIQVTSELWETIYMDKIQLVAVDHPDSVDIFVPEEFAPPPFPGMDIHQVSHKYFPISATDAYGNDLLPLILKKDDTYISNFNLGKYQGLTETHELILNSGEIANSKKLLIYLTGWIFPTDSSINFALSQTDEMQVNLPIIQVINKKGNWETVVPNLGFPMGKDKTVIADLSGKFLSSDKRIRIVTNMEIYWDQIFFSDEKINLPIETTILDPISADIHYRGFSRTYRKGGRYGPHWFDYNDVDKNVKWRDLTGEYTRYGDVLPLLIESDNKYIISNAGDETSINFDARDLPKLKKGWKRDFLIHSVGWVKDGDINTALGNTVLPLPYHGMSAYPPSKKEQYPDDPELQKYQQEYNTRVVTMDDYRNSIKIKNEE